MVLFINNKGSVIIGNHIDTDTFGEYNTSIEFEENDINIQLPAGGTIKPTRSSSFHLGANDSKYRTIFLSDGVIASRTSIPSDLYNGLSFFHATSKKWVTYYNGVWYSATGEVIEI